MAQIAVLTEDARLFRMLFLLLEEAGHTVNGDAPVLLLTDTQNIPPRLAALPRLVIGEGELVRPFSHAAVLRLVEEALAFAPLPLLTPTEQRLFDTLRAASPRPVSRAELSTVAFGTEEDGGRLNLYICYLRKKIEADGRKRIFACRGKGYYYDADTSLG